jgi:hypothetical protein
VDEEAIARAGLQSQREKKIIIIIICNGDPIENALRTNLGSDFMTFSLSFVFERRTVDGLIN